MIRSFADDDTKRFYAGEHVRPIPIEILARAANRLTQLNAATDVNDLRMPPSNKLETLKGKQKGLWSIRINDQWRVCFRFEKSDAFDVEIVDYH